MVSENFADHFKYATLSMAVIGSLRWDVMSFTHLSSVGRVVTPSKPVNSGRK